MMARTEEVRQFATFLIDGLVFGIEVLKVQEVIPFQDMTAVPLASDSVKGLINLRGQIALAIDTRHVMGMPSRSRQAKPLNLVVRSEDGIASLLVDDIGDVVDVLPEMRAAVPDTVSAQQKSLLECVYMLRNGLMLALDITQLLDCVCKSTSLSESKSY
jgi:purine-binding chemotaxis protein CheW